MFRDAAQRVDGEGPASIVNGEGDVLSKHLQEASIKGNPVDVYISGAVCKDRSFENPHRAQRPLEPETGMGKTSLSFRVSVRYIEEEPKSKILPVFSGTKLQ